MTRHSAILTNLLCSLPFAGLLVGSPGVSAQMKTRATIPFAFSANNVSLPAGAYEIQMVSEKVLTIRNTRTSQAKYMTVRPEYGREAQTRSRLVFQKDGGDPYLTQIWVDGSAQHSEILGRPRPQRELVARKSSPGPTTVEIALK